MDMTNIPSQSQLHTFHRRRLPIGHTLARFSVPGAWLLLSAGYALAAPDRFLTRGTFQAIFGTQQILVFVGMALLCTLAVGEIDLSVTSMLASAATLITVLVGQHGQNIVIACVLAVVASTVVGVLNGIIVVVLGIDSVRTTLGTGALMLGLALMIQGQAPVSGLSDGFTRVSALPVFGLPISFYYGLAVALIMGYLFGLTPLGRNMRFTRANREAARLAGIRVSRIRFSAFTFAGLLCGMGGVLAASTSGGYDVGQSAAYLIPALAVTTLGTMIFRIGHANPIGSWIAVYFLATAVTVSGLPEDAGWTRQFFYGAALVLAATASTLIYRRTLYD
jgi:ribose transport system permease protein